MLSACWTLQPSSTGPGDHKGWWSRDTLLGQYRLVAGGSSAHWATANTTTEIIYCSWSSCLPIWNNGGVHLICVSMPGLSPPAHWYTVQLPTLQWQCWRGGGAVVYFVFTPSVLRPAPALIWSSSSPSHKKLIAPEIFPQLTVAISAADDPSVSESVFAITEKAPTRANSCLKALTRAY